MKDLRTHAILLEGKSENGLYPLRLQRNSLHGNRAFTALLGIKTSSLVWHFRLGHSSFDVVSRVVKHNHLPLSCNDFNKNVVCTSCQLGKSKRQPFHSSTHLSTTPLQLVHTDIWTSPVQSMSGCKYYMVFIDDFSRYTWLSPLYNKSEVLTCFVKFKLMAENQFSTTIKQLQSDGGGEYTSLIFQSFLTKHGIVHRKSCPYTSQQNGLAERKLRHILETGLTLLAHSHLSNRYWVDAFLTAVYIINRLPTPILDHMSPFLKLYNKEPDYNNLRVFGCLCYPLLRPQGLHKLEYRSKPCIFIGYSYAGYRCLDPITNKVYLSRHVIFYESSFLTKDKATSHLPSKIHASGDVPFPFPFPPYNTFSNLPSSIPSTTLPNSPSTTPTPNSAPANEPLVHNPPTSPTPLPSISLSP